MADINYQENIFLDIVNEDDQIIDVRSRKDAHDLGLLHREIQVWMFDKDKNVFFQRMGLHKKSAGLLDATVAGHVNKGEEYLGAAIRETKEETGISITPSDLVLLKKFVVSNRRKSSFESTVNNFIRAMYIYNKPIDEKLLKKEEGITGGGFRKFSYDFLLNLPKDHQSMIKNFVLVEEIPEVLNYLRTWKS